MEEESGFALQFAAAALRSDRAFLLQACALDGFALKSRKLLLEECTYDAALVHPSLPPALLLLALLLALARCATLVAAGIGTLTSPFYGQPYLFCPGDVAAPHSIKFFATHIIPGFQRVLAATNTEFPLVTSDTVSRPLPEHSTTQTPHNNPHVCRPHRNGTPSLLSERHNAARNTRTCGIMTRHAPSAFGENRHPHPATCDEGSDAALWQKERNANSWRTFNVLVCSCFISVRQGGTFNSYFSLGASFWIGLALSPKGPQCSHLRFRRFRLLAHGSGSGMGPTLSCVRIDPSEAPCAV